MQKVNARRAPGIGTTYANAQLRNSKKSIFFFPVAEEAFETSRNSSESQRCLPRQRTQRGTDETYSALKKKQKVKAAKNLESVEYAEIKR